MVTVENYFSYLLGYTNCTYFITYFSTFHTDPASILDQSHKVVMQIGWVCLIKILKELITCYKYKPEVSLGFLTMKCMAENNIL